MTESVNSTVITGRRIKGPESPEPLIWISLAPALSFGDAPTLAGHVAILPLTGLDRSQINRVVCFHHEDKRAALTNLHGLRRHQRGIFEQIENKTHTDEFQRPESMVWIGGDPSCFHRARAWLNRG